MPLTSLSMEAGYTVICTVSFPAPPFLDHTQYETTLLKHESNEQAFKFSGTNGSTARIEVDSAGRLRPLGHSKLTLHQPTLSGPTTGTIKGVGQFARRTALAPEGPS
jgi:hypothetical protein